MISDPNYLRWSKTGMWNRKNGRRNSSGNNIGDGRVLCAGSGISINGLYTKLRMVVASCRSYSHRDVGSLHGAARQRLHTSCLLLSPLLVAI
ncbi:unnamed protein product [Thlaspi arvense]|uniref:Uncharacterized protein n=1 Tax=Thlaspi arvense TaxID=13288 RepID=A0AAU9SG27_THLAR|nr:unnamed protein product [Thlaspi arvense]